MHFAMYEMRQRELNIMPTKQIVNTFTVNCCYRGIAFIFSLLIGVNAVYDYSPRRTRATNEIAMNNFNQQKKKSSKSCFFFVCSLLPDDAMPFVVALCLTKYSEEKGSDRLMRAACAIYYADTK